MIKKSPLENPDQLIQQLCQSLHYLNTEEKQMVRRAYHFAAEAHTGQTRKSGEPYICHPISVAQILAEFKLDVHCIVAALLHDVIEDTQTSKDEISEHFSPEVAHLVDGVSKLEKIGSISPSQAQADNFRKMMLATVKDIRVILIKLADRLHNMRTLGVMRPDKKRRIAKETLEIYVPLANRLGINRIQTELENLCMRSYYPWRSCVLAARLPRLEQCRETTKNKILQRLQNSLSDLRHRILDLPISLPRAFYHLKQGRALEKLADTYYFRIIVPTSEDCYRALGLIHQSYKPIPGNFKDFIALPKQNGYQSLHTTLVNCKGNQIKIQICSETMYEVSEVGITHPSLLDAISLQKDIADIQSESATDFLNDLKSEFESRQVFVFTPKGEIISLPTGATVLDFAYAIHTEVGHQCVAARIGDRFVPLSSPLRTGQIIEVFTRKDSAPKVTWLEFVKTAKAKSSIRAYFNQLRRDKLETLGHDLLEKELNGYCISLETINPNRLTHLLEELGLKKEQDLFYQIGRGELVAEAVAIHLLETKTLEKKQKTALKVNRRLAQLASCCHPIPGDPIIGILDKEWGLVIHHTSCKKILDLDRSHWVDGVKLEPEEHQSYAVSLILTVQDKLGTLAKITHILAAKEADIKHLATHLNDDRTSELYLIILVKNQKHLHKIMQRLQQVQEVLKVKRNVGAD